MTSGTNGSDSKKPTQGKRLWQKAFKALKTGETTFDEPFHLFSGEAHPDPVIHRNGGRYVDCGGKRLVIFNFLGKQFSCQDLSSTDNTGNARLWLSEECLAYYIVKQAHNVSFHAKFANRRILELGSGKTGLAGLCAANYPGTTVHITDGNVKAVENVQRIVEENGLDNVEAYRLDWTRPPQSVEKFDVIVASDCVYFERYHCIIDCMEQMLTEMGTVYMAAPYRKGSLEAFLSKVDPKKWEYVLVEHPDWCSAIEKLRTGGMKHGSPTEFNEDLHLPRLVILRRVICQ
uniref:Calmodulin-lysine N-methyltransferase n=1 Tax=Steinernema glaseri TaxID=37863 RepID=A0A1I8AEB0_9BILA